MNISPNVAEAAASTLTEAQARTAGLLRACVTGDKLPAVINVIRSCAADGIKHWTSCELHTGRNAMHAAYEEAKDYDEAEGAGFARHKYETSIILEPNGTYRFEDLVRDR